MEHRPSPTTKTQRQLLRLIRVSPLFRSSPSPLVAPVVANTLHSSSPVTAVPAPLFLGVESFPIPPPIPRRPPPSVSAKTASGSTSGTFGVPFLSSSWAKAYFSSGRSRWIGTGGSRMADKAPPPSPATRLKAEGDATAAAVARELPSIVGEDDASSSPPLRLFALSLRGVTVEMCTLGASITRLLLPAGRDGDGDGERRCDDCVLGYDSPSLCSEAGNPAYFGAIVGRVANRIGKAEFTLRQHPEGGKDEDETVTYKLDANNGPNHLHGGLEGFSHRIWDGEVVPSSSSGDGDAVRFTLRSEDGDQGYPASLLVTATYTLVPTPPSVGGGDGENEMYERGVTLGLKMRARLVEDDDDAVKKATPINLAQHSYFNLAGHDCPRGILDHTLLMPSEEYTPTDVESIPTREVRGVGGNDDEEDKCMDFRSRRVLSDALVDYGVSRAGCTEERARRDLESTRTAGNVALATDNCAASLSPGSPYGFDHNYVIKRDDDVEPREEGGGGRRLRVAGVLEHPPSGRRMTVLTDAPGVQLYTANYLDGRSISDGLKDGATYSQWQGLCLETQHYPDSIGCGRRATGDGVDNAADNYDSSSKFAEGACFILEPGGLDCEHNVEYRFDFFIKRVR